MFPARYFAPTYFDEAYFSNVGANPIIGAGGDTMLMGAGR